MKADGTVGLTGWVSVNGKVVGTTPVELSLPFTATILQVDLQGYMPFKTTVELTQPKTGEVVKMTRITVLLIPL
jgi:hypothetical protein